MGLRCLHFSRSDGLCCSSHVAPWGCFVLLKLFTNTGGLQSCIVDGQCVSVVCYVFRVGGAVAQLFQNLWCLGFVMRIPTPLKRT